MEQPPKPEGYHRIYNALKELGAVVLRGISMHNPPDYVSDHYNLPDVEGEALEPWLVDTQEIPRVEG